MKFVLSADNKEKKEWEADKNASVNSRLFTEILPNEQMKTRAGKDPKQQWRDMHGTNFLGRAPM